MFVHAFVKWHLRSVFLTLQQETLFVKSQSLFLWGKYLIAWCLWMISTVSVFTQLFVKLRLCAAIFYYSFYFVIALWDLIIQCAETELNENIYHFYVMLSILLCRFKSVNVQRFDWCLVVQLWDSELFKTNANIETVQFCVVREWMQWICYETPV